MWFRKASPRRKAIREDVAEAKSLVELPHRPTGHVFLISTVFFLVAAALQFWPGDPLPYRVQDRAPTDLRSPVSFTVVDPRQTETLREATRATSPPVLVEQTAVLDHLHNQLIALKQDLQGVRDFNDIPADTRGRFPELTEGAFRQIQSVDPTSYAISVRSLIYRVLHDIPFLSAQDAEAISDRHSPWIALTDSKVLSDNLPEVPQNRIVVIGKAGPEQRKEILSAMGGDMAEGLGDTIASYLLRLTTPTYVYDSQLTTALADQRAQEMKPFGRHIEENQVLVRRGEEITADSYQLLARTQDALHEAMAKDYPWATWLARLGRLVTVLILTVGGALYVARMNAVGNTFRRGWAVCGLLTLTLVAARLIVGYFPVTLYLMGIAPTLLTAIILVIAYNQRFALGLTAIHGLLVTITLNQSIDFYLMLLAGASVFCFGLQEIRTQGRFIEIGALSSAAIFIAMWALGLSRMVGSIWSPWIVTTDIYAMCVQSLWAASAGILVGMFALAMRPLIERVFHIVTAMTLLELCDANKPLLRRLSQEALGTFNHSLTVGIMAEAAGNAIGANGLLCRVGAYYHDVGKLSKPQYFIENQTVGAANRHDKLSPAMSLLIIVGHVKDGIELAREYGLPLVVHQFIGQHHGTTLVEYFFHAAKKRQEQEGEDSVAVSETEFRYPGPKPQTREAAIVMICDACESVVRAIDEPTAGRIETAVHNMTMKRLMDGQFSDCNLTLHDLSVIEQTLVRTMAGIYHGRVNYPVERPLTLSQPA